MDLIVDAFTEAWRLLSTGDGDVYGIALRTLPADDGSVRQVAHGPIIKAGKPVVTTVNDTTVIR